MRFHSSAQFSHVPRKKLRGRAAGTLVLPGGQYVVQSDSGFRHDVPNPTEGNFIFYAYLRGHRLVSEVEIKAQGGPFERREGVHVEWHRVLNDFVEKILAEFDLALPQHPLVGPFGGPPKFRAAGD